MPAAKAKGFYRPEDRGLTIVSDGENPFEIPCSDSGWAEANGFRDLLKESSEIQSVLTTAPVAEPDVAPMLRFQPFAEDLEHLTDPTEEEVEQEQLLEHSEGLRRTWLLIRFWFRARQAQLMRQLGGTGISILVHVAIVLLLASFVFLDQKPKVLGLTVSPSRDDVVDDVVIDVTPIDVSEPTDVSEPVTEASDIPMELMAEAPDLSGAIAGDAIKPPTEPPGKPAAMVSKSKVFGGDLVANDYVFVIDNSNSMTKGRFETALHELMVTVNQLTPRQRFYVIFYSDTAYPMMHPKSVLKMVNATDRNKEYLNNWLQTVPLCLRTMGKQAIGAAFQLNPDVIYILGDGAFSDGADKFFAVQPKTHTIVHTRGMEVNKAKAAGFKAIAKAHGGSYKDVGVTPKGAALAKQFPRPRNDIRGPVWGVTLPLTKKKKKK